MSLGQKLIDRPKVRFNHPPEDSVVNSVNGTEKPDEILCAASIKPRVRSMVILEEPFKLSYANGVLPCTLTANKFPSSLQNLDSETAIYSSSRNDPSESMVKNPQICILNPQITSQDGPDDHTTACSINDYAMYSPTILNDSENCIENKNPSSEDNVPGIYSTSTADDTKTRFSNFKPCNRDAISKNIKKFKGNTISAPVTCVSRIKSKRMTSKMKPCSVKFTNASVPVFDEHATLLKDTIHKNAICKPTHQKKQTYKNGIPNSTRISLSAKTIPCGLKSLRPGIKTCKTHLKSSPVKKTLLRDVNGHSTNVWVTPGITRFHPQPSKMMRKKASSQIRPDIIPAEKLGRPEYNSIICTIDELNKVQEQKFITDVDDLPLVYRNLVNEKISAALDFRPDEAIYKNLVGLSVNENQLPSRFTRSKDPEPRYKDIVPKLSDFLTPSYSEEYCTAIQIRSNSPEITSKWSAFTISDKIFGWKHDMDQC
ncbi:uncharacterized protein LOC105687530 isoform X2 [Athalia rosae]|uniref:uncharacterized protein LOC105687530 isoform X2 n=1 Tax=Athalia rosae TaxID=37344 RepID=UPI0020333D61|nr:uncharacterized protein LOC105687530 isoform X2 [Athalia rosae]